MPNRFTYALAANVIGLGLFASLTPSPLYRTYSVISHFSALTLTPIYATYAFGVLTTLLLAGAVAAYGSLSVRAVLAGVAVSYISLRSTFEVFGSVVAAIALVVAFEAWRTQPTRRTALEAAPEPAQS